MPSVPPQTESRECRLKTQTMANIGSSELKTQTMANIGSSELGDNGNYPLLELAHTDWDNWAWHQWSLSLSDCVRKRPHRWLAGDADDADDADDDADDGDDDGGDGDDGSDGEDVVDDGDGTVAHWHLCTMGHVYCLQRPAIPSTVGG